MELFDAIRTRKSVRSWSDQEVSDQLLHQVIDMARLAPSAKNLQDWHVVIARDPEVRRKIGEAASQPFVGQAPAVLAVCGDTSSGVMSCGVDRWVVDTTILIDHIVLCATALGLGTCWIGHFSQDRTRAVLSIPESWEVIELLPIGFPADSSERRKTRKPAREIVSWDAWGQTPPEEFS